MILQHRALLLGASLTTVAVYGCLDRTDTTPSNENANAPLLSDGGSSDATPTPDPGSSDATPTPDACSPIVVQHGAACSSAGAKEIGDVSYAPKQGASIYVYCTCNGSVWQCPSADEVLSTACGEDTSVGSGAACSVEASQCVGYEDGHNTTCTCEGGHLSCLKPTCESAMDDDCANQACGTPSALPSDEGGECNASGQCVDPWAPGYVSDCPSANQ